MLRSTRPLSRGAAVPALLALTAALAVAACDQQQDPLAPSAEPESPAIAPAQDQVPVGFAGSGGQIAIESPSPDGVNIRRIGPLGGSLGSVTSFTKETVQNPSWSWDNKRIAMTRWRPDGQGGGTGDIWIVNADGFNGHWARPYASPWSFLSPAFSVDGTRIVMCVYIQSVCYLGSMDLATGNATLIYYPAGGAVRGNRPTFDPTGTRIVYIGGSYSTVEQIKLDGTGHKVLVSANNLLDYPSFSPDGKRVAYEKGPPNGNSEIWVKTLATGANKQLTFNGATDRHASWSPDGTRLVFWSTRSGKGQVHSMSSTTGGDLKQITKSTGGEGYPSWSH